MKFGLKQKLVWASLVFASLIQLPAHAGALMQMNASDFNRYITESNHGLVILLPSANWCSICRKLDPEYEKAADDLKDVGIAVIKMDYDANHKFMDWLGIESLPQTEVYYHGVRRWEYQGGMPELRLVFEAKQAMEAANDGSFSIKRYSLLSPVR